MSKIIVYFSRKGSTKAVAEMVSEKIGAQIYEIIDPINRKGLIGFMRSGFQAKRKKHVHIKPLPVDLLDGIEELIIATPLWAGNLAPATPSFLEQAQLEGKNISIITVQADPSHKAAAEAVIRIKEISEKKGAKVNMHYAFIGSSPFKEPDIERLKKQVEEMF